MYIKGEEVNKSKWGGGGGGGGGELVCANLMGWWFESVPIIGEEVVFANHVKGERGS